MRGPFFTIPNAISLARIPLALGAIACLVGEQRLAAQVLMVSAFASDALDGAVARRTGTTSEWGRVLDPLADKLVFAVLAASLAWLGMIPWWLLAAIVGRDLLVTIGALLHIARLGTPPRPHFLGRVSTVMLAVYLTKQAFWPAAAIWAGLDPMGWVAVALLAVSTIVYAVVERRDRVATRTLQPSPG